MYLKVLVKTSAPRERVEETSKALVISVREPAEANRANTRVREIVAEHLSVSLARVRIVSGHHARSKILSVPDA